MKTKNLFFITFLLTVVLHATSVAQDNTQVALPEGAIARLGKGGINIMRFSPDGSLLAVGTDVCIWIYDVADGTETVFIFWIFWSSERACILIRWKDPCKCWCK